MDPGGGHCLAPDGGRVSSEVLSQILHTIESEEAGPSACLAPDELGVSARTVTITSTEQRGQGWTRRRERLDRW